MNLKVSGKYFKGGVLSAPPSKSQSQRAIIFASMATGESEIANILLSPDINAMVDACTAMGAKIKHDKFGRFIVKGVGAKPSLRKKKIDVGGSGQVLRFFPAIALCKNNEFSLMGDVSVCTRRSMADLCHGFQQLGVSINYHDKEGFAPLSLKGRLKPGRVVVAGEDSQVVSALLIGAYYLDGVTRITITNPGELPWLELTKSWLGGSVSSYELPDNMLAMNVIGRSKRWPFDYIVPGDFSSIAYIVAAAAIKGVKLEVNGLDWNDPQGDQRFVEILISLDKNGVVQKTPNGVKVAGKALLVADAVINVNDCIDMVTIVAVLACCASGETQIRGAAIAQQKESRRLDAISSELKKMGAKIKVVPDGLDITGGPLNSASCDSWGDHRIAMALAVASVMISKPITINGADCVNKSYPGFWQEFTRLGAEIEKV